MDHSSDYDSLPDPHPVEPEPEDVIEDHSSDYDSLPDPHPVEPEPEDVIQDIIEYVLAQVIYRVAEHEDLTLDCNVTLDSSGPWEDLEDMVHLAQDAVVEEAQEGVDDCGGFPDGQKRFISWNFNYSGPWEEIVEAVVEPIQNEAVLEQEPIVGEEILEIVEPLPLPEAVGQPIEDEVVPDEVPEEEVVGKKRRRSERLVQRMLKIKRDNENL